MALSIKAHAKVNLALSVGPPEPAGSPKPGWHRICSWMQLVEFHDKIEIVRLEGADATSRYMRGWSPHAPSLGKAGPRAFDWPVEKDLITRAHRLMEQRSMRELPAAISVMKSIPAGGGLGGGSSDAAAVMRGLNELFELGFTGEQLRKFSQPLGSDVAFFIDDGARHGGVPIDRPCRPAIVSGFGDAIERVGRASGSLVLIFPPLGCPTPAVYKAYDARPRPLREAEVHAMVKGKLTHDAGLFNDLVEPALRVQPQLGAILSNVRECIGRAVHLSGSGSTCFVIAKDDAEARSMAAALLAIDVTAVATKLV